MNRISSISIKIIRSILGSPNARYKIPYKGYLDLCGQSANDYIYDFLSAPSNEGKMICKFGTVELANLVAYHFEHHKWTKEYIKDILNYNASYNFSSTIKVLCNNAGFFPCDISLGEDFYKRTIRDIKEIDILASYIYQEKYFKEEFCNIKKRVDLDGYYAPFMWKNPWTRILKDKKVLIVHPFTESIEFQYYNNREHIWEDSMVLPEFKELITLKAVQSIAGQKTQFKTWFDALHYMEDEISKLDFDIALIGCGAYGMCLAAHVKRMGKIGIHLAGWTQFLFGIYGNRWLKNQPEYAHFINKYWIRPNENERPQNAKKVEGGCYW